MTQWMWDSEDLGSLAHVNSNPTKYGNDLPLVIEVTLR